MHQNYYIYIFKINIYAYIHYKLFNIFILFRKYIHKIINVILDIHEIILIYLEYKIQLFFKTAFF